MFKKVKAWMKKPLEETIDLNTEVEEVKEDNTSSSDEALSAGGPGWGTFPGGGPCTGPFGPVFPGPVFPGPWGPGPFGPNTPNTPNSPPGGCFQAGTKIETPEGLKNIEDIKVGDKVKAYDFKESKTVDANVWKTTDHEENTDGMVINGIIKTTTNHPFYEADSQKWIRAEKLKVGDKILHVDGEIHTIEKLELTNDPATVYNFEVEGEHNYFAEGYLVHNEGKPEPGKGGKKMSAYRRGGNFGKPYGVYRAGGGFGGNGGGGPIDSCTDRGKDAYGNTVQGKTIIEGGGGGRRFNPNFKPRSQRRGFHDGGHLHTMPHQVRRHQHTYWSQYPNQSEPQWNYTSQPDVGTREYTTDQDYTVPNINRRGFRAGGMPQKDQQEFIQFRGFCCRMGWNCCDWQPLPSTR